MENINQVSILDKIQFINGFYTYLGDEIPPNIITEEEINNEVLFISNYILSNDNFNAIIHILSYPIYLN